MTTTHHEHGAGEHGAGEHGAGEHRRDDRGWDEHGAFEHRRDDRGWEGDDHDGERPGLRSCRGRRPTGIDLVAGLALTGLVAALDLSSPGAVAASSLAAVTGALVRVDVAERRLPNVLVLVAVVGAAAGVVDAVVSGDGVPAAWACLLGLVVLAACVPLVRGGGLGAGDAKLASVGAVAAALVSPTVPPAWLVAVAVLGGVHGTVAVAARRRTGTLGRAVIPFGPVMLVGWWLAVVTATTLDRS